MVGSLTVGQVEQYKRDGVLFPFQALPEGEINAIFRRMLDFKKANSHVAKETFAGYCHFMFPRLFDLITYPSILDAVESLLGPDTVLLFATSPPMHGK